jgi:hypothetical protein
MKWAAAVAYRRQATSEEAHQGACVGASEININRMSYMVMAAEAIFG